MGRGWIKKCMLGMGMGGRLLSGSSDLYRRRRGKRIHSSPSPLRVRCISHPRWDEPFNGRPAERRTESDKLISPLLFLCMGAADAAVVIILDSKLRTTVDLQPNTAGFFISKFVRIDVF